MKWSTVFVIVVGIIAGAILTSFGINFLNILLEFYK